MATGETRSDQTMAISPIPTAQRAPGLEMVAQHSRSNETGLAGAHRSGRGARSPNLVITRAGPRSLHPQWFCPDSADFDLLVTAYHPDTPRVEGEWRIEIPGTKVAGYGLAFDLQREIIEQYEYVALLDDDIETKTADINACFRLGKEYSLYIWQPSLTEESYFTYVVTLKNSFFKIRYTNYVEMMCPFFTQDAFRRFSHLFEEGLESGLDLVWSGGDLARKRRLGILDLVSVKHTRPVGQLAAQQGFDTAAGYGPVIAEFLRRKRLPFRYPRAVGGILKRSSRSVGPVAANLLQLRILGALSASPQSTKYIARSLYHLFGFGTGKGYPVKGDTGR